MACCRGCTKRFRACHDTCEEYKTERKEQRAKKIWLAKQNVDYHKMIYFNNITTGDRLLKDKDKARIHAYR